MNIEGKRILVIGGAGFIGSHVVAELLREPVKQVVVFDNFVRGTRENLEPSLRDPRCRVFADGGDIRDVDVLDAAVRDADCVFHLAALWLLHCKEYPRAAFHVNVEGTFNVLEACVRHRIEKLVYSSSASVYGDAVEVPMTESHPFNNKNFYGSTKIAGEAMCTAFHDRYQLPIVGLRYMNIYGPGQDQQAAYSGVIPLLLNKIARSEPPTVNGDGSQAYDFTYVSDVARANVLAAKSAVPFGFFNAGTGVGTTVRELCELILRLTGSRLDVTYQPYSADDVRQLVMNRIGSTEAARTALGFEATIPLEEGLKRLIEWRNGARG